MPTGAPDWHGQALRHIGCRGPGTRHPVSPMLAALLSLVLLLTPPDSSATDSSARQIQLMQAVEAYVAPVANEDVRLRTEWADLNGDGTDDALVYVESESWCGSGGCTVVVFEAITDSVEVAELGAFRPAAEISLMHGPVVVAETQTEGWADLLVQSETGSTMRLCFTGETYPMSPSDGIALAGPAAGTTLFASAE